MRYSSYICAYVYNLRLIYLYIIVGCFLFQMLYRCAEMGGLWWWDRHLRMLYVYLVSSAGTY